MTVGNLMITPEVRTVIWQGARGGVVWSTPSAVLVEGNGRRERIPVLDVTRIVQALLLSMIVAVPVVQRWLSTRGRKDNKWSTSFGKR